MIMDIVKQSQKTKYTFIFFENNSASNWLIDSEASHVFVRLSMWNGLEIFNSCLSQERLYVTDLYQQWCFQDG